MGESGPYAADDVARLMAEGACDWTTEVMRDGLSTWRAGRRDALLVIAVARARGLDGATQPTGGMRALLHPDPNRLDDAGHHDTWVDPRPSLPELHDSLLARPDSRASLFARASEVRSQADGRTSTAALRSALPESSADLAAVPQAPEAALPVATSSDDPAAITALRESTAQVALRRSLTGLATDGVDERSPSPMPQRAHRAPWLVTPWVGLAAFIAGIVFALAPGRLVELTQSVAQALRTQLTGRQGVGALVAKPVPKQALAVGPARLPQAPPRRAPAPEVRKPVEFVRRALPVRTELHAELDRLSPLVQRCMRDPSRGVELDLVIEGITGHVDDVRVATPSLTPGAIECIREVFVDFHVAPFVTPELRLAQRYRW